MARIRMLIEKATEKEYLKIKEILEEREGEEKATIEIVGYGLEEEEITLASVTYKPQALAFYYEGKEIHFPFKKKKVLIWFFKNPGKIGSRMALCEYIYGEKSVKVKPRIIDAIIKYLRKELKKSGAVELAQMIRTVHYEGYRLETSG